MKYIIKTYDELEFFVKNIRKELFAAFEDGRAITAVGKWKKGYIKVQWDLE